MILYLFSGGENVRTILNPTLHEISIKIELHNHKWWVKKEIMFILSVCSSLQGCVRSSQAQCVP